MLKLEVIGNLGRDAKVQETINGKFVAFNVAHTSKRTDRATGATVENTTWVSCTMNGDGRGLLPYLLKGTKVYVSGEMTLRAYKDQQGMQQVGINLFVRDVELCGSAKSLEVPEEEKNRTDVF